MAQRQRRGRIVITGAPVDRAAVLRAASAAADQLAGFELLKVSRVRIGKRWRWTLTIPGFGEGPTWFEDKHPGWGEEFEKRFELLYFAAIHGVIRKEQPRRAAEMKPSPLRDAVKKSIEDHKHLWDSPSRLKAAVMREKPCSEATWRQARDSFPTLRRKK